MWRSNKLILVGLILSIISYLFRFYFIATSTLIDDEALYFYFWRHLALSYVEHGPGVAWFIGISTLIFGENGFGVRFNGVFIYFLLSCLLYFFGKKIKDEYFAWLLFILFSLNPFFSLASFVITSDSPMILFIFLSVLSFYWAIFINKKWFYLAGLLLGLGLLSKVSTFFVALSILTYFFLSRKRRELLKLKEFYLAFFIAGLIYLPVVIWNFQNDFAFLEFVKMHLEKKGGWKVFIDLWAAQLILYSPLLFPLMLYLPIKYFIQYWQTDIIAKDGSKKIFKGKMIWEKLLFFSLTSFIPLLYILPKTFENKLEANWPAFAMSGGFILAVLYYSQSSHKKIIHTITWIQIIFLGFFNLFILSQAKWQIVNVKPDITNRYYHYQAIRGTFAKYYEQEMDHNIRIVSRRYQIPSMVNFYIKPKLEAYCIVLPGYHESTYSFVHNDEDYIGKDFYYLKLGEREKDERFWKLFESYQYIKTFDNLRNGKKVSQLVLYYCKNYRGKKNFVKN